MHSPRTLESALTLTGVVASGGESSGQARGPGLVHCPVARPPLAQIPTSLPNVKPNNAPHACSAGHSREKSASTRTAGALVRNPGDVRFLGHA